jgi:hypothetical protein
MRSTLLFILVSYLVVSTVEISIPLIQNQNRCMIVYTSTPDENLILDMKFPTVLNQESS